MESKIIPTVQNICSMEQGNICTKKGFFLIKLHLFINAGKRSRAKTFISVLIPVSVIHADSSTGLNFSSNCIHTTAYSSLKSPLSQP